MGIGARTLRTQRQVSGMSTLAFERFAAKLTGKPVSGVFSIGSRDNKAAGDLLTSLTYGCC